MPQGWASRRRRTRSIHPEIQFRKYVRLFLSSGKALNNFSPCPKSSCMFGRPATRRQEPSSRRIELEALLPGICVAPGAEGTSVRELFRGTTPHIPTGTSCPLSSGQSVSTGSTSRWSAMWSTMPQIRCMSILRETGLRSLTG